MNKLLALALLSLIVFVRAQEENDGRNCDPDVPGDCPCDPKVVGDCEEKWGVLDSCCAKETNGKDVTYSCMTEAAVKGLEVAYEFDDDKDIVCFASFFKVSMAVAAGLLTL